MKSAAKSEVSPKSARKFDLVVYGATGFTGGLVADYLAESGPEGLRWALAGRDHTKLAAVRERLVAAHPGRADLVDLPLVHADSDDAASLSELAAQTRLVLTTVGPYYLYGEPLVAACAAHGTDYVDLTGEPEFIDRMYVNHHETARESGARLVHACGFDSIPHDLGAWFTAGLLPEDQPITMRGVVRSAGRFSGGTFHSAVGIMGRFREGQAVAKERRRLETRPVGRRVKGVAGKPHYDALLRRWLLPLPTVDPIIVLRSAAALERYGPDFRYSHYAGAKQPWNAAALAGVVTGTVVLAQIPPIRNQLLKLLPQGSGPDEKTRERAWFTVDFVAEAGDGTQVHTRAGGGDPGYTETSKMISEAALCLLFDDNPPTAGQVTTAVAMGEALLSRLRAAGLTFEVVD